MNTVDRVPGFLPEIRASRNLVAVPEVRPEGDARRQHSPRLPLVRDQAKAETLGSGLSSSVRQMNSDAGHRIREALAAYQSVQSNEEHDYLSGLLGVDVYA